MTSDDAPPDVDALPGRRQAAALAGWAEGRRASGEFPSRPAPRPVRDGGEVDLREVSGETVREICALQVAPDQRRFVAPNAVSFAEAHYEPKTWYRAVYADGQPVGFAMLSIETATPEYHLWRFMIDGRFQGRGYGRAAIGLIVEHVRSLPNARELLVSWVPGDGSPEPFYLGLGFVPTGEIDGGEVVARLELAP
jgi:diamine N-acetyltransferase